MNEQKIWFVSDVHFFHNNILKFCPATRHGETALEMNEYIVQAWNSKIHRRDIVYNLGDVSFGSVKNTDEVLSRLNGQIHLIYGNHDNMIRQNKGLRERFASVQDVKEIKVTLADGTGATSSCHTSRIAHGTRPVTAHGICSVTCMATCPNRGAVPWTSVWMPARWATCARGRWTKSRKFWKHAKPFRTMGTKCSTTYKQRRRLRLNK